MPSRGMPDRTDVREIERRVELGEKVDCRTDVVEGVGPAATCADAPVLDVPRGEAVRSEVGAEALHQRPVVLRLPVPAVDDDRDGKRPGAGREEELCELTRVVAVGVRRAGHGDRPVRRRADRHGTTCGAPVLDRTDALAELRGVLLQEHEWRMREGLV